MKNLFQLQHEARQKFPTVPEEALNMKTFYRIADTDTNQGVWYNMSGQFTGLIHSKFNFCKLHALPMPFDPDIVNYLSATESLDELFNWFPKEDIIRLSEYGYQITEYKSADYKFHNGHWLILKDTAVISNRVAAREYEECDFNNANL